MIYKDQDGFVVDQTGDGGDSANFHSCVVWLKRRLGKDCKAEEQLLKYFWNRGQPVRHPKQEPWNNHKNFSGDQATLLMSVLPPEQVAEFMVATMKRGFFLPNTERDWPGSEKKPYPERLVSKDPSDNGKLRWFDWADPAGPDFMGALAIWSKKWWAKWMIIPGKLACAIAILTFNDNDFKQLFVRAEAFGLHKWFLKKKDLRTASTSYFLTDRNMKDLHDLWMEYFNKLQEQK